MGVIYQPLLFTLYIHVFILACSHMRTVRSRHPGIFLVFAKHIYFKRANLGASTGERVHQCASQGAGTGEDRKETADCGREACCEELLNVSHPPQHFEKHVSKVQCKTCDCCILIPAVEIPEECVLVCLSVHLRAVQEQNLANQFQTSVIFQTKYYK